MNRRRGGHGSQFNKRSQFNRRPSSSDFAHLIIHNRGRKGVKDADLAHACGFTVQQMYRRLGQKLLKLTPSCRFELRSGRHDSDGDQGRPVYAFTLSGVIMIMTWLGTDRALDVGTALVPLLEVRRRASKNKQRRPRRQDDPPRQTKYQLAWGRFQIQRIRLEKSIEKFLRGRLSAGTGPAPSD